MAEAISSELYNCIPNVEKQHAALARSAFPSVWSDIFEVFVGHGVQSKFGLALLHRHLDLPTGHAMVHAWDQSERDLCQPEELGRRNVHPQSYCLHNGRFIAYEFAAEPTSAPPAAFLQDLKAVLQRNQLESIIAVTHISNKDRTWTETTLEDCKGTVAVESNQDLRSGLDTHVATEWAFRDITGTLCMVAVKTCKTLEHGGHDPNPPK